MEFPEPPTFDTRFLEGVEPSFRHARVIPFEILNSLGEFPRLGLSETQRAQFGLQPNEVIPRGDPRKRQAARIPWQELAAQVGNRFIPASEVYVDINNVPDGPSFNVFISHCWSRTNLLYPLRDHADDEDHNKYKLCIKGIEQLWKQCSTFVKQCHVWLDYSCINQDGIPVLELKYTDEIIEWSDMLFTPIVDLDYLTRPWEQVGTDDGTFEDYKSPAWNQGPSSYLARCFCRLEMMHALSTVSDVATSAVRLAFLPAGISAALTAGRHAHVLYGTREYVCSYSPITLPPLQYSWFDKYSPVDGSISREEDRAHIRAEVEKLLKYKNAVVEGYEGEYNDEGKHHTI